MAIPHLNGISKEIAFISMVQKLSTVPWLLTPRVPSLARLDTLYWFVEAVLAACSPPIEMPLSDMAGLEKQ